MTDQIPDVLIVDGVRHAAITRPPLPHNTKLLERVPEEEIAGECTGCWRGYVAAWEIEGSRLYLKAIDGPVADLAPMWRMTSAERVLAQWFSGVLRATSWPPSRQGEDEEVHFKIFEGRVTSRRLVASCSGDRLY
ncbi:MAG: hypothetical protein R3C30_16195 [Hyphomonadaceae bacterium]